MVMYQELKQTIRDLEEEYSLFPLAEVQEVERLQNINYLLYSIDDITLLRSHSKVLKKIKRAKRNLNKRYAWEEKMQEAPNKLSTLNEMVKQSSKLFCMDLEFCEKTSVLTEVGVSIFNPQTDKLEVYHFVVLEHYSKRNGKYVPDHKDDFKYGISQILPLKLIEVAVLTLVQGSDYLVGHAFANDKAFLTQCGYYKNTKVLDTQKYAPYALQKNQQMSLANVVRDTMAIEPECLHNGGNDAYYTMKSLLSMANVVSM